MWKKTRARKLAEERAKMDAFRESVRAEVLGEVRQMISLSPVTERGVPNLSELNIVLRNMNLTNLNLKFFGYDLARKLADALPPNRDTVARVVDLRSKLSTQADMESDWVAHWCAELGTAVLMHRKLWEYAYVLQALHENGMLRPGARGLGFGCGEEPLPSYLASRGVAAVVTDLGAQDAQERGWAHTGQHAATLEKAYHGHLVDRAAFDQLVSLEIADMNAIPKHLRGFDFCWSICALEHLGSITKGLDFIEKALETVNPGGVSVHTTEFNINPTGPTVDNWPTVLFQGKHFEALASRLRARGHYVAEMNFDPGNGPMDRFIDLPPWAHDQQPELMHWFGQDGHLKVGIDGFPATCFGILVKKAE